MAVNLKVTGYLETSLKLSITSQKPEIGIMLNTVLNLA